MPFEPEQSSSNPDSISPIGSVGNQLDAHAMLQFHQQIAKKTGQFFNVFEEQASLDPDLAPVVQNSLNTKGSKETLEARKAFEEIIETAQDGEPKAIELLGGWANMEKATLPWPSYVRRTSDKALMDIFDDESGYLTQGQRNLALKARRPREDYQNQFLKDRGHQLD